MPLPQRYFEKLVRLLKPAVAALVQLFAAAVPSVAANLLTFWSLLRRR
jgi:hypothetical protein